MAIYAKSDEGYSKYEGSAHAKKIEDFLKKELPKVGFNAELISVVNSTSTFNVQYNLITIAELYFYNYNGNCNWFDVTAGKGPDGIKYCIFRTGEDASKYGNWYDVDTAYTYVAIFDDSKIIKSNRTYTNPNNTDIQYFNPIVDALPIDSSETIYASSFFNSHGIWDELLNVNIQCKFLERYMIDEEEYICISGNPNYQGGVLAKLTSYYLNPPSLQS